MRTYCSGGGAAPDAITVDTGAVPPGIEKIVVTASPDAAGQTFQGIEPTATIRNADDNSVLGSFTPPQLGTETALVVVEIYLRNGAWKARAVGQGYANGLAGIATDFGVSVEEPAPGAGGPAGAGDGPVTPPAPAMQAPVAPPAPAAPPAPPAAPPIGAGKINLDKGRVSLQKNQTVSLVKGGLPSSPRSRWASAGSPRSAARTSTWTPRSSPTARSAITSTAATSASCPS